MSVVLFEHQLLPMNIRMLNGQKAVVLCSATLPVYHRSLLCPAAAAPVRPLLSVFSQVLLPSLPSLIQPTRPLAASSII